MLKNRSPIIGRCCFQILAFFELHLQGVSEMFFFQSTAMRPFPRLHNAAGDLQSSQRTRIGWPLTERAIAAQCWRG